jgi:hypothetical protein
MLRRAGRGIIARPRIQDTASLAFAGASVAGALSAVAFSPAECVSKNVTVPAAAATKTAAKQRREISGSRVGLAQLDLGVWHALLSRQSRSDGTR